MKKSCSLEKIVDEWNYNQQFSAYYASLPFKDKWADLKI
jgi:hypothetical protein